MEDDKPNAPSSSSSSSTVKQQQQPPPFDPTPMNISASPLPHSDQPSSSSAEIKSELIQESKRIKQEDNPTPSSPTRASSSPTKAQLSSIPPASQRPFYNKPHSGRPPRSPRSPPSPSRQPHQTQSTSGPTTTTTTTTSGPIHSAGSPTRYSNPAQKILHAPDDRAHAKFRLARQKAKKENDNWMDPVMTTWTRSGPSPLGPGIDPYDRVKEVVSDVKEHLNKLMAIKIASKKYHFVYTSSSSESDSEPCTVEEVIKKLEKYLDGIPRSVTAQEMEDKLIEFQVKVEADPPPTWYSLMKKSTKAFWDELTDYFVCEALESELEDEGGDGGGDSDEGAASGSGSNP